MCSMSYEMVIFLGYVLYGRRYYVLEHINENVRVQIFYHKNCIKNDGKRRMKHYRNLVQIELEGMKKE